MNTVYQSKALDHLGLVAGMYDELKIGEVIDQMIPQDFSQRIVSIGQSVKAMVLNGLGFVNQRLYLIPSFFQNKPTEVLIGEGVLAEHLNDDTLGRALDSLFDNDVTTIYSMVSQEAVKHLKLDNIKFGHLDTTSFHVDGKYNSEQPSEENVIRITQGYSRDHRPELNQVGLQLIVENKAGIPILMEPLNGNASDKSEFHRLIHEHIDMIKSIKYLVADSALYTEKNLKALDQNKWITRVPETLKDAKTAIDDACSEAMNFLIEGYWYQEIGSVYADIKQRWIIIESEHAKERALKSVNKKILKGSETEMNSFDKLCRQTFACIPDAQKALADFQKTCSYIKIEQSDVIPVLRYNTSGRPKKGQTPDYYEYQLTGCPSTSIEAYNILLTRKSRFIIATNELDDNNLSIMEILEAYKNQSTAEGGFRFLKDPLFLASSLFLKSPKRIMALLMIMTICLLVYAALAYRIRQGLKEQDLSVPNQKGTFTQRPTIRWIFHLFSGIHILIINKLQSIMLNMNANHFIILDILGARYRAYYS